ncbi:MAG TPA: hypothetical protein VJY35_16325 [Candidatus Eisenbacteria bacterium]|nr:hypothetical protein [Candidatus Eisenbacteria bacterium]
MMRPIALVAAAALAGLGLDPRPCTAGWDADGVPLHAVPSGIASMQVVPDGQDGALALWSDPRTGWPALFTQRVSSAGEIAAGWPASGVQLGEHAGAQFDAAIVAAGDGGAFVAWQEYAGCHPACDVILPRVRVLRLTSDGRAADGWPASGLEVAPDPTPEMAQGGPTLLLDGAGGVFVAWSQHAGITTHELRAQRIDGSGTLLWAATPGGVVVSGGPARGAPPALAPDGLGGLYLAWQDRRLSFYDDVFAQRLDAAGTASWNPDGVAISIADHVQSDLRMLPDGAGGALLFWGTIDTRGYSGASLGGQVLHRDGPVAGDRLMLADGGPYRYGVAADGAGGAALVWDDYGQVYALRVNAALAPSPGWPAGGFPLSGAGSNGGLPVVAADGAQGMTLAWADDRRIPGVTMAYAVRLRWDRTPLPGWPVDGLPLAPLPYPQTVKGIAASTAGAIVVVLNQPPADLSGEPGFVDILAQRVAAPAAIVTPTVSSATVDATPERVRLEWSTTDGAGVAFLVSRRSEAGPWVDLRWATADAGGRIVFEDRAVEAGGRYGYRLGFVPGNGPVRTLGETWVTIPSPLALRGASPNPGSNDLTIVFALPDAAPATLELFDTGGRLIESREVGALGAGTHALRIVAGRRLPSGLYHLRLKRLDRVLTARASVLR